MSMTSEEEVDEDGIRPADIDANRPISRHDSSDSGNLPTHSGIDRSNNNNHNDHPNHDGGPQNPFSPVSISDSGGDDARHGDDEHDEDADEDFDDYDDDSEDEDDEDDDDDDDSDPPQLPINQHTFAPPFYGRPPTPLPPSPSLTSLLRPSRPTTPDASDDDGHGHGHRNGYRHSIGGHDGGGDGGHGSTTAGGGSHQHQPGEPVPRARPRVPTYEYYGFVLYLLSSLVFLVYLLWSYLPSPFLHALGIYYYPNRWWSLAIPSFLVMLLVYIYVALALYNVEILTLPLESVETVVDEAAMVAVVDSKGRIVRGGGGEKGKRGKGEGVGGGGGRRRRGTVTKENSGGGNAGEGMVLNWREVWNEGTDAVMDVPLAGVCEVLYGEGRDWDSDLEDEDVVITRI
ncbi:PIG-P-domain-containing protein [Chaetomium sp. MPI-SDFR-AT-0129]|nr:PIG-P-domain-containing protein [Chaetomium sp. MPI-SDFR-AT-0129]